MSGDMPTEAEGPALELDPPPPLDGLVPLDLFGEVFSAVGEFGMFSANKQTTDDQQRQKSKLRKVKNFQERLEVRLSKLAKTTK